MIGNSNISDEGIIEISDSDSYKSFLELRDELVKHHKDSKIPQPLLLPSYLVLEAVNGAVGKYQVKNGITSDDKVNRDGMIKISDSNAYDSFIELRDELIKQHKDSKIPQSMLLSSYSVLETINGAIDRFQTQNDINSDESINKESNGPRK